MLIVLKLEQVFELMCAFDVAVFLSLSLKAVIKLMVHLNHRWRLRI